MLAEHIFVTTHDGELTLALADDALRALGFAEANAAGTARENSAEWSRGVAKPKAYIRISELPQRVRLDYDRGRVTLAVSVHERAGDKPVLYENMLLAIASAIETGIRNEPVAVVLDVAKPSQDAIEKHFRRQRLVKRLAIGFLLTFLLGVALLVVMALL